MIKILSFFLLKTNNLEYRREVKTDSAQEAKKLIE